MRFGFVTCVQLGLSCMQEIYDVGGRLDLAVTLPDETAQAKSGRVYLDAFCQDHGIDLVKSPTVNDAAVIEAVRSREVDWLFIIGWSQIAREEILGTPKRGVLGMHPTLLPEGRGRASIPWAILKGLDRTGVTLFKLDAGVDTGPILAQEEIPMSDRETATTLYAKVEDAHRQLIHDSWPRLVADEIQAQDQRDELATLWPGRRPEDGEVEDSMSVGEIDRLVRAVTHPYPGAYLSREGRRLRVWAGVPTDAADGVPIRATDGVYTATEYDWET